MATTHSTAIRNGATDWVISQLGASPKLCFRLTGTVGSPGAVASTLVMGATPFGAASAGTATAAAITQDSAAAGNAAAVATATLQTSAGVVCVHCAVAASAADINMSGGLTINAGDIVQCSSLTYTALPA